MANIGANNEDTVSATSGAGVVDVITLKPCDRVRVVNRSGASAIYARADGVAPAVAGADAYVAPAAAGASVEIDVAKGADVQTASGGADQYHPGGTTQSAVQVQVISAAATDYTVEVVE